MPVLGEHDHLAAWPLRISMWGLCAALLWAAATALPSCTSAPTAPAVSAASAAREQVGPFSVLVEGLCPKLKIYDAGAKLFLVYGTYGLDAVPFADVEVRSQQVSAAQSFVEFAGSRPVRERAMLKGLPTTRDGYLPGDIELGGRWPDAFWLARIETSRGAGAQGVLYERRRLYYAWEKTGWWLDPRAKDAATPGMLAPELPEAEICEALGTGLGFATYAAERLPSGDAIVVGRCEDSLHRASGGVRVAVFLAGQRGWRLEDAPASPLFDSIVNLELVFVERRAAYLYAYPPYARQDAPAYLVRFDGAAWSPLDVPLAGPIVSMAAEKDGTLWAVSGWRELWRCTTGKWKRVPLPRPVFVEPADVRLRLLEVQAVGDAIWVHAAYPIFLPGAERAASRGHVLFTTRPVAKPLHCDRRQRAARALSIDGPTLEGAQELR